MQASQSNAADRAALDKGSSLTRGTITLHPFLAIVGVLLGALTSVFTGRLLTVGLPDLQGAIGASSDAMTWVATSYNVANMFIGPLTVFLGALFGARRVLLWASVVFILSEFVSPFVAHNIGALIIAQFVAGMAAGTYYPLTMTGLLRSMPLKYIYLGVAAYSLDILSSTHIATALEAWYITNFSWQWIFWNALLVTPLLMVCVFFGLPRTPLPERSGKTNLWGFLYASSALSLLYLALDQGERLDWFNSGVINGLFVAGVFLLAVTLVRRVRQPSPLLNLKFLCSRNFLLLGVVLTSFRFLLLGPALLLPKFLELLHGYRPEQTGGVLAWIAIPELIAAPLAGLILYKADSRLICAIGFVIVGLTSVANSKIDPGWTGETFVVAQVLNAIGLAFALTGLLSTILRSAMASGALENPINILTISCWFQSCRLFGAEIGKAVMVRFLAIQGNLHYTILARHVDGGFLTEERTRQLLGQLFSAGSGIDDAKIRAALELGKSVKEQVGLLAISDGFVLIALCAASCMAVMSFLKYVPPLLSQQKQS